MLQGRWLLFDSTALSGAPHAAAVAQEYQEEWGVGGRTTGDFLNY